MLHIKVWLAAKLAPRFHKILAKESDCNQVKMCGHSGVGVPEVVLRAQSGGGDGPQLAVRPVGHLPHDSCRNSNTSGARRQPC